MKIRSGKMRYVYNSIDASGLSLAVSYQSTLDADVVISSAVIRVTRCHILRMQTLNKNVYPAAIAYAVTSSDSEWNAGVISEATLGAVKLP
ncbi:MAG: hypothetical protein DLM72_20150 [Candidatus Nitrosopolaris wilkensis]|nr:MAG: hypothetical protein DLM72_20150 [Candidatus Nitrosopolaris wilkensis]